MNPPKYSGFFASRTENIASPSVGVCLSLCWCCGGYGRYFKLCANRIRSFHFSQPPLDKRSVGNIYSAAAVNICRHFGKFAVYRQLGEGPLNSGHIVTRNLTVAVGVTENASRRRSNGCREQNNRGGYNAEKEFKASGGANIQAFDADSEELVDVDDADFDEEDDFDMDVDDGYDDGGDGEDY